jgi:hypothetical protein
MAIARRAEIRAFAKCLISCRIAALSDSLNGGTEGFVARSADSWPKAPEIDWSKSDMNAILRIEAVIMGTPSFSGTAMPSSVLSLEGQ